MTLENFFRCGVRMLIAGAALHGLGQMVLAEDVESAEFETSNVSRSQQISLVSDEKAPPPPADEPSGRVQSAGPGVARVPGCTSIACPNGACANGSCTARAGACGPNGCRPGTPGSCGPNGCPSCRAGGGHSSGNGYTFRDAGQAWSGAGHATGRAVGSMWRGKECDWNDETGSGSWSGNGPCPEHGCKNCPHCCGWLHDQWAMFNARNRQQGEILRAHIHGKFAYFHPMGNGGEGAPPFGCYHLVYAVNPDYSDPRDAQVYAAQGYGVPMSVPLAPTVRHTMNYSTGIPASRLTPISNVVPPRGGRSW
jgi:hypothetical protein